MQHRATVAHTITSRIAQQGLVWALLAKLAHAQEAAPAVEPQPAAPAPEAAAPAAPPVLQTTALPALPDDFQYGLDALKAGNYQDAVLWFKAIYDRDQTPGALLNLGIAYANLGKPHDAVQALDSYIARLDAQADAQAISEVRAEIERLKSTNGRIGVHLIPADANVELDGVAVTLHGGELYASPGKHKITARAKGYKLLELTLDVIAGEFTLEIELEKITPVAPVAVAAAVPADTKETKATKPQTEATDEPEASAASSCALQAVCMGPVVSLLGPPNLIGGGLHVRIGRYLGVGFDYQALPTVNFNPVSVGTTLVSGNARVYPFGGSFFIGGGLGYQTLHAGLREGDISISARTGFPAAMASIGFMGHDGFVLGMDLGLLFPLSNPRASIQANTGKISQAGVSQNEIDDAKDKAETQVNKALAQLPLSIQLNLLRLGYMF